LRSHISEICSCDCCSHNCISIIDTTCHDNLSIIKLSDFTHQSKWMCSTRMSARSSRNTDESVYTCFCCFLSMSFLDDVMKYQSSIQMYRIDYFLDCA